MRPNDSAAPSDANALQPEAPPAIPDVQSRALLPHHREHLHGSGLSDETILRRGYWSCDAVAGRTLLNWPPTMRGDASGLVIPYPNVPGYAKVRTDRPRARLCERAP